jgi:hypothetical protein
MFEHCTYKKMQLKNWFLGFSAQRLGVDTLCANLANTSSTYKYLLALALAKNMKYGRSLIEP